MTLLQVPHNTPYFIATSSEIVGGYFSGTDIPGSLIYLTDTQTWKVVTADLTCADYVLPVGGTGGGVDANGVLSIPFGVPPTIPVANTILLYADYVSNTITEIPIMTSNTTPSGVAFASEAFSGNPAYYAFNSGTPGWESNGGSAPWVLGYQFTSGKVILNYSVLAFSAFSFPTRCPASWTFEGSNNGTSYTVLDTVNNFTFSSQSIWYEFPFLNSTSYTYYRMNISANAGDQYCGVGGLRMFTASNIIKLHVLSPDGTVTVVA